MEFIFLSIVLCFFILGNGGKGARRFLFRNPFLNNYGKSGGQPEPPAPAPTPTETSREAISAQIEAVPRILETQREFGPQFSQLELEQLQQFGPQFTETILGLQEQFGPQLAEQALEEQRILAPERVAGSQALKEFIEAGPENLTPEEIRDIQQDVRGATAARGLGESGFSAQEELRRLTGARQALRSQFLNVALSSAGRLPTTAPAGGGAAGQAARTGAGLSSAGQLVQNVSPGDIFGGQSAANAFSANIFGTQSRAATAARGQQFGLLGAGIGAFGEIGGAFAGTL